MNRQPIPEADWEKAEVRYEHCSCSTEMEFVRRKGTLISRRSCIIE
jgi:hypothetical protein